MELTGREIEQLKQALLKAYSFETFRQMLKEKLEEDLLNITTADGFENIVFNVINKFNSNGFIDKLIKTAKEDKPGNETLQNVASTLLEKHGKSNIEDMEKNLYLYIDIRNSQTGRKKSKTYFCEAWIAINESAIKIYPVDKDENESVTLQYIKKDLLNEIFNLAKKEIEKTIHKQSYVKIAGLIKNITLEIFLDDELLASKVEEWANIGQEYKVVIRSRRALDKNFKQSIIGKWKHKWDEVKKLINQTSKEQTIYFKDETRPYDNNTCCLEEFFTSKIQDLINQEINIIALNHSNIPTKTIYFTCYKFTKPEDVFDRLKPDVIIFCILISNQAKNISQVISAGIPVALCLRQNVNDYLIHLMKRLFTEKQTLLRYLPDMIFEHRQKSEDYKDVEHTSLLWDDADRYPTKVKDENGNLIEHQMNSPI